MNNIQTLEDIIYEDQFKRWSEFLSFKKHEINPSWISMSGFVRWKTVVENPQIKWFWDCLSKNPNITWNIIRDNPNKPWRWYYVSKNPNITFDIVRDNPNYKWCWYSLSYNPHITWDIIQNNPQYPWDKRMVSFNPNITWDIIKDNPDYPWDWEYVSCNPNITWDTVQANPDKPWNYESMANNTNITWDIIEANPQYPWDEIIVFFKNPNFYEKMKESDDYDKSFVISKDPKLTWDEVLKDPDNEYWDWNGFCYNDFTHQLQLIRDEHTNRWSRAANKIRKWWLFKVYLNPFHPVGERRLLRSYQEMLNDSI